MKIAKTSQKKKMAQDILDKLYERYQTLKANDACVLYCYIRDYITSTYITEEDDK